MVPTHAATAASSPDGGSVITVHRLVGYHLLADRAQRPRRPESAV